MRRPCGPAANDRQRQKVGASLAEPSTWQRGPSTWDAKRRLLPTRLRGAWAIPSRSACRAAVNRRRVTIRGNVGKRTASCDRTASTRRLSKRDRLHTVFLQRSFCLFLAGFEELTIQIFLTGSCVRRCHAKALPILLPSPPFLTSLPSPPFCHYQPSVTSLLRQPSATCSLPSLAFLASLPSPALRHQPSVVSLPRQLSSPVFLVTSLPRHPSSPPFPHMPSPLPFTSHPSLASWVMLVQATTIRVLHILRCFSTP